jgi:hypothetical protein
MTYAKACSDTDYLLAGEKMIRYDLTCGGVCLSERNLHAITCFNRMIRHWHTARAKCIPENDTGRSGNGGGGSVAFVIELRTDRSALTGNRTDGVAQQAIQILARTSTQRVKSPYCRIEYVHEGLADYIIYKIRLVRRPNGASSGDHRSQKSVEPIKKNSTSTRIFGLNGHKKLLVRIRRREGGRRHAVPPDYETNGEVSNMLFLGWLRSRGLLRYFDRRLRCHLYDNVTQCFFDSNKKNRPAI